MEQKLDYRALWRYAMDPENFDMTDELRRPWLHFIPGISHNTVVRWFLEHSGLTYDQLMEPILEEVYAGFEVVQWADLQLGDRVAVDNYRRGKFWRAAPRLSGPYIVVGPGERMLQTTWLCGLPSQLKRGEGHYKILVPGPDEPILKLKFKNVLVERLPHYEKYAWAVRSPNGWLFKVIKEGRLVASTKRLEEYLDAWQLSIIQAE